MQTSATNKRLRMLLTGIRDQTLIPNPHFQRRLVWSNAHKVAFLKTVLEGLPFPEIFIASGDVDENTGDGTELIVDGQQRITTLHQYFSASKDLRLSSFSIPPYAELPQEQKIKFLEYEVVVRDLGPLSEDETRDIFQRINSTRYSLNAMEVNNSRFDGELKRFAEEISNHKFFEQHKVFSALDGRRMNDVRFTLTLLITMITGYFNRDDEHENFLEHFNDEFPGEDDLRRRIERVMSFIDDCNFPSKSRVWQKADLLTVMIEVDQAINVQNDDLDPSVSGATLSRLFDEVDDVTHGETVHADAAEYYRRVRSGINDRISRISRGDVIRGRLAEAPSLEIAT
jgi:hypothetical protein